MQQKAGPVLVVLLIITSFMVGSMWTKIQYLETSNKTLGGQTQQANPTPSGGNQAQQQAQVPTVSLEKIKALFTKDHITFGDANKKILFVEISDPSCPFCHFAGGKNPELSKQSGQFQYTSDGGTYNPPVTEMRKLVESGKASFVWLYSMGHGAGVTATQALYCSHEKGKFWAANDLLMSNAGYDLMNNKLEKDTNGRATDNDKNRGLIVDFLSNVVDPTFLGSCLKSGKYAGTLDQDQQTALSLGFRGTPDFFVNEKNFSGAVDYKKMESTVKALL